MNVAAYCRVSTDSTDQANSLENQIGFFNEISRRNPSWNLVSIYSDEGITGTNIKKREEFSRMIRDAECGKFGLILTKEVSRFARNTLDTLQYTRYLKTKKVGVFFINDNINTLEDDGEFRLSIMASVAQEESRKTSSRVRWGMHRQMERGYVFTPPMLGFDCTDGVLTVNESEAWIVRRIFDMYVNEGLGAGAIAQRLAAENVPVYKRIKQWSPTCVLRILHNEKYAGDLVQHKTVVTNYLEHESVENNGIVDKISFEDHHPAVISREMWNEAQQICAARNSDRAGDGSSHNNRFWCSGKVFCGVCGGKFVTKKKKADHSVIRAWRCSQYGHQNGESGCTNKTYIDERILLSCMQFALRKIPIDVKEAVGVLRQALMYKTDNDREIKALEAELDKLCARKRKLLELLADGTIDRDEYMRAVHEADGKVVLTEARLGEIRRYKKDNMTFDAIEEKIASYIQQSQPTTHIYESILDKIVVFDDRHVDISLCGINTQFSVSYRRSGRGEKYTVQCADYIDGN